MRPVLHSPLKKAQADTIAQSSLYLTALLGKTIVSHIVDDSTLAFSQGLVTNVTDNGFTAALKGALLNVWVLVIRPLLCD